MKTVVNVLQKRNSRSNEKSLWSERGSAYSLVSAVSVRPLGERYSNGNDLMKSYEQYGLVGGVSLDEHVSPASTMYHVYNTILIVFWFVSFRSPIEMYSRSFCRDRNR